jgi:hypothetical protein
MVLISRQHDHGPAILLASVGGFNMAEKPPEPEFPQAARIVGVVYLTFCSGVAGAVPLYWHPQSIYAQFAFGVAVIVGLIAALLAPIKDPAARPIRWGLVWLALGCLVSPGPLYLWAFLAR